MQEKHIRHVLSYLEVLRERRKMFSKIKCLCASPCIADVYSSLQSQSVYFIQRFIISIKMAPKCQSFRLNFVNFITSNWACDCCPTWLIETYYLRATISLKYDLHIHIRQSRKRFVQLWCINIACIIIKIYYTIWINYSINILITR